jgi:cell division protein FtsW (lipid II flippase)
MGLAIFAYGLLAVSGIWMFYSRSAKLKRPSWLRSFHYLVGTIIVLLVMLLLAIGIVGTLGHYGSLGHSPHLLAGITVVILVLLSAGSATQINASRSWFRSLHIGTNIVLFAGFVFVLLTGWEVVQKYLP